MVQRTIRELAEFICGNKVHGEVEQYEGYRESHSFDVPSFPRKNQDIRQLFLDAVPEREGDVMAFFDAGKEAKLNKRDKTVHALKEFCAADQEKVSEPFEYLLCELAAPRTYRAKTSLAPLALIFLNAILEFEDAYIIVERGRPRLMAIERDSTQSKEPNLEIRGVVEDNKLLVVLEEMWIEVLKCREAGAHMAAMILLGGVLEGLLRDAAERNPKLAEAAMKHKNPASYSGDPTLAELIPAAEQLGLIAQDRQKNLQSVREIRNLVHPYRRVKAGGLTPSKGSVNIAIQVLHEIARDLTKAKVQ